jgi:hypothetical protein
MRVEGDEVGILQLKLGCLQLPICVHSVRATSTRRSELPLSRWRRLRPAHGPTRPPSFRLNGGSSSVSLPRSSLPLPPPPTRNLAEKESALPVAEKARVRFLPVAVITPCESAW